MLFFPWRTWSFTQLYRTAGGTLRLSTRQNADGDDNHPRIVILPRRYPEETKLAPVKWAHFHASNEQTAKRHGVLWILSFCHVPKTQSPKWVSLRSRTKCQKLLTPGSRKTFQLRNECSRWLCLSLGHCGEHKLPESSDIYLCGPYKGSIQIELIIRRVTNTINEWLVDILGREVDPRKHTIDIYHNIVFRVSALPHFILGIFLAQLALIPLCINWGNINLRAVMKPKLYILENVQWVIQYFFPK